MAAQTRHPSTRKAQALGALGFVCLSFAFFLPRALAQIYEPEEGGYSFNPLQVKRDPFKPPESHDNKSVNELTLFDTNEMKLVAILTGSGSPQAMLVLPNKKTHIVQTGDAIGRRNGVVVRMTSNEVVVRESFVDFQGRKKTILNNLVLAE